LIGKENRAGIYLTVIVHLSVLIILLLVQIGKQIGREESFVLDFSKQEELAKQLERAIMQEKLEDKLNEMIEQAPSYRASDVRNVAVNRSALKDDRGTDADQLYKDAERLQKELNAGNDIEEDPIEDAVDLNKPAPKKNTSDKSYSGPSVVSYSLDGRKASHLNIPAYRCMGAGDVTVIITVNPQGHVIAVKVLEDVSTNDNCLRDYAIRAARLSKFSVSQSAPPKQNGTIVYKFIAQ